MNVYEHVTPQQALEGAVAITKWTKPKEATLDKFTKNILVFSERSVTEKFAAEIKDEVQTAYDTHVELHGDREMAEMFGSNKDDWDTQLDDALEAIVEPYQADLSQDWLANATTGGAAGLHEEGGIDKWCAGFGKEIWKQMMYGKSAAQQMAALGLVDAATIAQWHEYGKSVGTTAEAVAEVEEAEGDALNTAIVAILAHVGVEFDEEDVKDALDMVMDDDDILSAGAAQRLGIYDEHVEALRMAKLAGHSPSYVIDMLNDAKSGIVATDDKPKRTKRDPNEPPPPPKGDAIPLLVFQALKEHSAVEDGKMAEALGVSRSTYTNYAKGKTPLSPTTEQFNALRECLVDDINGLSRALAALDNDTYVEIV